ncbi:MAG: hypothetical protein HN842_02325, partial [Gammaproteobacteria bacterium]|nr:hypothetical protein [Gammaproteobacteria bacterium]
MAAVQAPEVSYTPSINQNIIDEGRLSEVQLESLVRAGDAHSKMLPGGFRKGFAIGDGTGVGKGAQIAGIIEDNRNKGRNKAVWVSLNKGSLVKGGSGLFSDARRDIEWVGGDSEKLFFQGKTKFGGQVIADEGTLFTTYTTLSQPEKGEKQSRLDQLVEWLGEDFDGVIAFDEAHTMGNNRDSKGERGVKKASGLAKAGIDLQKRLPQARVVYVSATSATEVGNLGYAERLGLWGEGTAFANKDSFISDIESGGIAAMEVVAKDMKAMGAYTARSLSYDGVDYDSLIHKVTPDQRDTYDTLARAWQNVLKNIDEAMAVTGGAMDGRARGAVSSRFWGAHQGFFSQILTSMQMPSVIGDVEQQLKDGNSAVLQLVNTNEATQERRLDQAKAEGLPLEEVDITPRDILMQFVQNGFPTAQYEEYVDEDGNDRSRPVTDSDGNAVENPQAVAMRDRLLMEIGTLQVPEGPLEQLINHFGSDAVAEITGRKRRLVRKPDGSAVIEKLGEAKKAKDSSEFNDGKKRILVFSKAGGTERSYHASK